MILKNIFLTFLFMLFSLSVWADEKNYYEILGVSSTATQEEIKQAYNTLDKERPTEEIKKAYETLSDSQKRQEYDKRIHDFRILAEALAGKKNYYEILEVSRTATQEEIRRAFRALAMKIHPDRVPVGVDKKAKELFIKIRTAYEILKNPERRRDYDRAGHKQYTQAHGRSDKSQTKSFYEATFKDIFNRTDKESQRPISQRSLYLFEQLMLFENSKIKTNSALFIRQDMLLQKLLAELNISSFTSSGLRKVKRDKETRERILKNTDSYNQDIKNIRESNDTESVRKEQFKQSLRKFITELENKYIVEKITTKERQAIKLFYRFSFFNQAINEFVSKQKRRLELLKEEHEKKLTQTEKTELTALQTEEKKDLKVFRDILSALGLPGPHHDLLLKSYLGALRDSLFREKFGEEFLALTHSRSAHQKFYMEDREILKSLKEIKTAVDSINYENLKRMSNPFKANFLKNFPGQFIVFQAAIGASLYRQSLTDRQFTGAEKNPEIMSETMNQLWSPSGVVSFFIFVAVAQQINYRIYGWGRWLDGKSLGNLALNGKTVRAVAPGIGLGLGFFVSTLFDELMHDPYLAPCVKSMYKNEEVGEEMIKDYSSPCDNFYNNWSREEKWKNYAVDIATLIGAGLLSRKLVNLLASGIRLIPGGSNLFITLARILGRSNLWVGALIGFYAFIETHAELDHYIGQPLKNLWGAWSVEGDSAALTKRLDNNISKLSYAINETGDNENLKSNLNPYFLRTIDNIKALGVKFEGWVRTVTSKYDQSARLWGWQTNKLLRPYEASSQLLKDIFVFSHLSYNSDDSISENQDWDSYQQISEKTRDTWIHSNKMSQFNQEKFEKKFEKNQESFYKYCSKVNESLSLWSYFCNRDFNKYFEEYDNTQFFRETAQLIDNHLQTISLNKEYELNPIHYISLNNNELFSSDPEYSIKKLNWIGNQELFTRRSMHKEKQLELSRILIKAGLDWENSLSYLDSNQNLQLRSDYCAQFYPNYTTDRESYKICVDSSSLEDINEIYRSYLKILALNKTPAFTGVTRNQENSNTISIKQQWAFKILSAGIYLLKDVISDLEKQSRAYNAYAGSRHQSDMMTITSFAPIVDLLSYMEVYKKGERRFENAKKKFIEQAKENLQSNLLSTQELTEEQKDYIDKLFTHFSNPYILAKNMICGSERETGFFPLFTDEDEILFSSKKFFNSDSLFIYDNSQYQTIDNLCKNLNDKDSSIHSFLFNIPAKLENQQYENLYLALEELLKRYPSTENLENAFKDLSQDQVKKIRNKISYNLEQVTENYYKEVINKNSLVYAKSTLEEFLSYYNEENIGDLKGLEISIFQVNYWMNILKKFLLAGEENNLNYVFDSEPEDFQFNQEKFEIMQKEVLSLLQSYNDTFVKNYESPYFTLLNESDLETVKNYFYKETDRQTSILNTLLSMKQSNSSAPPVVFNSRIILSHILASSIPVWNSWIQISLIIEPEQIIEKKPEWQKMITYILIELNKSINNIFTQLYPLQLKEDFDHQADLLQ